MDVVVCIKRVPDTETKVRIAADGKSLDLASAQWITAPYDEMAVEKALRLRDAFLAANPGAGGSVTVVTLGPAEAGKELRTALAMGADKAIHVVAQTAGLDASATSEALAAALKGVAFDVCLCGKQATDDDDAAVGPMLAERLGLPCVAFVTAIDVAGKVATVKREIDGEVEVLEVDLPAVFTAQKGLAEARLPGLKGIMAAKKKPLEERPFSGAKPLTEVRSLAVPAGRKACVKFPPTPEGVRQLLKVLRTERGVL
jgi:electron transfer flavoprotein beta subunit